MFELSFILGAGKEFLLGIKLSNLQEGRVDTERCGLVRISAPILYPVIEIDRLYHYIDIYIYVACIYTHMCIERYAFMITVHMDTCLYIFYFVRHTCIYAQCVYTCILCWHGSLMFFVCFPDVIFHKCRVAFAKAPNVCPGLVDREHSEPDVGSPMRSHPFAPESLEYRWDCYGGIPGFQGEG